MSDEGLIHQAGVAFRKVRVELDEFYHEVVVENGPRYKDWKQWPALVVDTLSAFFDMNYTVSHLLVVGLSFYGLHYIYEILVV
jgi:hypothetical protein